MDRSNDILIPNGTAWLTDKATQTVCHALTAHGAELYFVGGCVRNALLGEPVSDIDLATNARPEDVMRLADAAGLQAVPTGIDHGTVTVVALGTGFEVTTFRKDVETDGRRAVVAFSDRIEDDARRRDFTINALYATPDGRVIDPLRGLPDLLARRVVFIEDATARIKEDALRILRFFRFSAWYANPESGFDPDTLDAIARNVNDLDHLSAERIGTEMIKLLSAPDPGPAIAAMVHTGVLLRLLPGASDLLLGPTVLLERQLGLSPMWHLRLAALGGKDVGDHLRLSRKDSQHLSVLIKAAWGEASTTEIAYRYGEGIGLEVLILRSTLAQSGVSESQKDAIRTAARAVFPLRAADLMPRFTGPALGRELARLEQLWIASGFTLGRDDLLRGL